MRTTESITQNLTILKGRNHTQKQGFGYISWQQLVKLVVNPPALIGAREKLKASSQIIAAHDAKNKTKEAVLAHNRFTLLRLDIDNTDLTASDIATILNGEGIESFIIHTTANHQYKGNANRYRVYIELSEPLVYQEWANCETYLASLFRDADDCATRPSQIMYLPFYFAGYHFLQGEGTGLGKQHPIIKISQVYCEKLLSNQKAQYEIAKHKETKKAFNEKLLNNQISIIGLIEQSYSWNVLLSAHQYKRKGKAWLAPESSSNVAGAYLLQSSDGKVRLYSHHASDPCAIGKAIDKFDFIVIREFGGESYKAIEHIAKTYFPDAHQHNRNEWKIHCLNGGQ